MAKNIQQPAADLADSIARGGSYVVGADGKAERMAFTESKPAKLSPEPQAASVAKPEPTAKE